MSKPSPLSSPAASSAPVAVPAAGKHHHHGNLRRALVDAGIAMLEEGEAFSLRAVARRVGVSQTAPYRHFDDKERLEAAMAAHGFRALQDELARVIDFGAPEGATAAVTAMTTPEASDPLVDLAVTYARYAVAHPALYHLMFGQPCGDDDERLSASADVLALIERVVAETYPDVDASDLATAGWGLAHGLASLYLDGKLAATTPNELEGRIRGAFAAVLVAARAA